MDFVTKLESAVKTNRSLLCVGLDPQPEQLPQQGDLEERLEHWGKEIIHKTIDLACCFKPNIAFYEQFGLSGLLGLQRIRALIPPHIPLLLDFKRGDIGSTAEAYARAAFEQWQADAVTLNPYLGEDGVRPFLQYAGKMVFLLCHTSNPSAAAIQLHGDPPFYEYIAQVAQSWGSPNQIGFVVGATQPEALARVRALCPEHWILAPGVGAQGGNLEEVLRAGLRAVGSGLIIPVSRGVAQAQDVRQAALDLRTRIHAGVEGVGLRPDAAQSMKIQITRALFETGCIQFGEFNLASGKTSPIYIDLRRMVSFPPLLRMAVQAYIGLLQGLAGDLMAAVPYAALPVAALVSMRLNKPLIYPRKEIKTHGTGQAVEGAYQPGQSAVLLEDVVTSGGSIINAIDILRAEGLIVKDVVVLVDRQQGGHAKLAQAGLKMHAFLSIREIIENLFDQQLIDAATRHTMQLYFDEQTTG